MKHYFFIIVLCYINIVYAQEANTTIVTLESDLKSAISDTEKIQAMLALGEYELDHNFSRAEYIITNALDFVEENRRSISGKYKALVHVQLGILKRRKSEYQEAISHYLKSLAYFEKEKDTANIADIYHNIGMIHKFQKDFKTSFKYLDKSIQLNTLIKNKQGLGITLLIKGSNYRTLKKIDSAEVYYNKAKNIFLDINYTKGINQVNNFLVIVYLRTNREKEAIQLSEKNIERCKKNTENLYLVNNYINISAIYYKKKEYRFAGKYVDSAIKLSKKEGFKGNLVGAYRKKSRLWYKLGNYKAAYLSQRKYKKYSDSLFNIDNTRKLQELELKYQFEQEQKEIVLAKKTETKQKWLYFCLFLLTLVSATIIGILVRRNYKNHSKIVQGELEKEQVKKLFLDKKIKDSEEETKRLIADNSMRLEFKQELLDQLKTKASNMQSLEEMKQVMSSIISKLQLQITTESKFSSIQSKIEEVNKGFDAKLRELYPKLTKTDREICTLMRLNLSIKEVATIRGSSIDAVKTARYRIRKKMNLKAGEELEYLIQSL